MVLASGQSTHLHRTVPGTYSPSHMPTQAVANPPKLVGFVWRAAGCSGVRTRPGALHVAILDAPLHVVLLLRSQPWPVSTRQGFHRPRAKLLPDAASVCCIVCGVFHTANPYFPIACWHTVHAMVPASRQSTPLDRTLLGTNSPSHMPTQAVANPPKLAGLVWRAVGCNKVRTRCTTCSNTR